MTLEPLSAGPPRVGYRVGGIAKYVSNAMAGHVVDPSPTELARGCRALIEDRAAWQDCSESALAAASTRYSADAHCAEFLRVVNEVLT